MIEWQMFLWVLLSIVSSMVAYFILTEGKSSYLFGITFISSILIGLSTSYLWIQFTRGLAAYDALLILFPCLISVVSTIAILAYYKAYHNKTTFPRIPSFKVSNTTFTTCLIVIALSVFLFSAINLPSAEAPPSMQMLTADDAATTSALAVTCPSCIPESTTMNVQAVGNVVRLSETPTVGEYMSFKIDASDSPYANPIIKVFITDQYGNLVDRSKIISYTADDGSLMGQMYCDVPGTYTLTSYLYSSTSTVQPMEESTFTFSVAMFDDFGVFEYLVVAIGIITLIIQIVLIARTKKHLGKAYVY